MAYTFRTMVVPADLAPLARALAEGLAGAGGAGMWTTGLSPSGEGPATHYVSTGMIEDAFVGAVSDSAILLGVCQQAGASVTLDQCQALVTGADVSSDAPFDAFSRLGLKMVHPPMED